MLIEQVDKVRTKPAFVAAGKSFATALPIYNDPDLRESLDSPIPAFAYSSWNAWTRGLGDLARNARPIWRLLWM
jgi:hypothetical protein